MTIATTLKRFLDKSGIAYQVHPHGRTPSLVEAASELGLSADCVASASIVERDHRPVLAVVPSNSVIDCQKIRALLGTECEECLEPQNEARQLFDDVEPGVIPPLAKPYHLNSVVDQGLFAHSRVYFTGGCHCVLVSVTGDDFKDLVAGSAIGSIKRNLQCEKNLTGVPPSIGKEMFALHQLPALPQMAARIMSVAKDEDSTASQLAKEIEQDPSVTAQVLKYAQSPLFGFGQRIDSVERAVMQVLGFDLVANIAMGIATASAFQVPREGPLGLDAYWRHATLNAQCCHRLSRYLPSVSSIDPGRAYLCGLLHNIGVLLIGHLFKPEFQVLNKLLQKNEGRCALVDAERQTIGLGQAQDVLACGHAALGAWLCREWSLGEDIACASEHHNDFEYAGDHQSSVQLVQLSNCLLASHDVGDHRACDARHCADLASALGLELSTCEEELKALFSNSLGE